MKFSFMNIAVYFIRSCASGQLPGCSCDKLIGKRKRQVELNFSGHITYVLCFVFVCLFVCLCLSVELCLSDNVFVSCFGVCLLCVCVFSWISLAMLHLFYARCLQLIKFTVKVSIVDMNILHPQGKTSLLPN